MGVHILTGDCREQMATLPEKSVQMCVTSPPYFGLRNYEMDGQFGLEETPEEYIAHLVEVFQSVRRVLADDGVVWINIGDSYAGSGKGGNPASSPHKKQASNAGSGFASAYAGTSQREAAVTNVTRKTFPGIKAKDLIGIPWMLAFALRADGWYLRQDIIWQKPNPMPESTKDRCTASHEYIFLLSKSARYFYDADAIAEAAVSDHPSGNGFKRDARVSFQNADGTSRGNAEAWDDVGGTRNKRSVWTVPVRPFKEAHFATFPPALIEPCILAGSKPGDTVLDPFIGSGTTALVSDRLQRNCIGIDLNPKYVAMAERRFRADAKLFAEIAA